MSGFYVHFMGHVCSVASGFVHATECPVSWINERKYKRKTHPTACGRQRAKLLGTKAFDGKGKKVGHATLKWPCSAAEAKEWGFARCKDCHKRTGRKSPVKRTA